MIGIRNTACKREIIDSELDNLKTPYYITNSCAENAYFTFAQLLFQTYEIIQADQ